jgi:hypothetical protein
VTFRALAPTLLAALLLPSAARAFIGDSCTADGECGAGEHCLTEAKNGVPGGSCSVPCGSGCASGLACATVADGDYCLVACHITQPTCDPAACRPGLVCQYTGGNLLGACWAGCALDTDCAPTGQTCDTSNGLCHVTNSAPLCTGATTQGCETAGCPALEECNPTRHLCEHVSNPKPVQVGIACTKDSDCGTGAVCFPEIDAQSRPTGWSRGYCSQRCGASLGPCPSNAVCKTFANGGFCLAKCNDNTGCRGCGYACDTRQTGGQGFCMAACTNSGFSCGSLICNPSLGLCESVCPTSACPAGWVCDNGLCKNLNGCSIAGCPANELCNPATNECQLKGCEQVGCQAGQFCDTNCHQCIPLASGCESTGCPPGQECSPTTHLCGAQASCEVTGCGCAQACDPTTHACVQAQCQTTGQCPQYSTCDPSSHLCTCAAHTCVVDGDCDSGEKCRIDSHTCYVPTTTPPTTPPAKSGCGCGAGGTPLLAVAALVAARRRRRIL